MAESNPQTEKSKVERSSTTKKATSGSKKNIVEAEAVRTVLDDTNSKLLSAINNLQNTIQKQTARMSEQEKKLNEQSLQISEVVNRLASYEEDWQYDQMDCSEQYESESREINQSLELKRKEPEDEATTSISRFSSMGKRFKSAENCDKDIDPSLASTITDLFRNGIDEDRYQDLIKDELNARPANCEGLVVVQTNPLIWDAVSHNARTTDKKMQNIETSVVKSATILAKAVHSMAEMEFNLLENKYDNDGAKQQFNEKFGLLIEEFNSVLALLGHCNKQINLTRKDFLRPQLNKEYSHLCNHNRPFTNYLFGEDVSKVAKEIEDCSKISNKMFTGRPIRSNFQRGFRNPRFRGSFRGGRGMLSSGTTSTTGATAKNFNYRRGPRQNYRQ